MVGAMHMPPPASKPKKSLSLRERMNLQKPSRPHAQVGSPEGQYTASPSPAPQNNTLITDPLTEQLPGPAHLEESSTSASAEGHGRDSETGGRERSAVMSATCRPEDAAEGSNAAAVHLHNGFPCGEDSDTDMTQEDLPTHQEPACLEPSEWGIVPQPLHQQPSPQQSKGKQPAQCELANNPLTGQAELLLQSMEGGSADDDACWEQALEAEMHNLSGDASDPKSRQPCTDAEVIQLDMESADDMLDVLADAAAAMPLARYRKV